MSQARPSSSPARPRSSASSSVSSTSVPTTLPFPAALSRHDFLAPAFDPAAYLSALHAGPSARHQSLEDLRVELRERGRTIAAELLAFVNDHHTDFLSLGDELRGGGDRVEDVRVALLGFRRAVDDVCSRVRDRRGQVGRAAARLRTLRGKVDMGRQMLELDDRLAELEARLAVGTVARRHVDELEDGEGDSDGEADSDGDGDGDGWEEMHVVGRVDGTDAIDADYECEHAFVGSSSAELMELAREFIRVNALAGRLGRHLPFVQKMEERLIRCRNTVLLDLGNALRETRKAWPRGKDRTIRLLAIYRLLDAQAEAVVILKEAGCRSIHGRP